MKWIVSAENRAKAETCERLVFRVVRRAHGLYEVTSAVGSSEQNGAEARLTAVDGPEGPTPKGGRTEILVTAAP